ncbi:MAG TPA: hypothetical protein VFX48_02375, partial [Saprospiraceae bacterium]|nr:hypothetical protein [Saprospiraceae bacterium]
GSRKTITSVCSEDSMAHQSQLFDYSYTISTGKSSIQYHQTVFFINSKQLALPQFHQKPETFFTRLWSALGMEDIDFNNFSEYSDRFHLKGPYEEVIRYYFSKEVLSLLSNQPPFYMEGMNYYFILYLHNKLCPPEQLTALRNLGMMLYELFKIRTQESEQLLLD